MNMPPNGGNRILELWERLNLRPCQFASLSVAAIYNVRYRIVRQLVNTSIRTSRPWLDAIQLITPLGMVKRMVR